jgi:hypothetical protein
VEPLDATLLRAWTLALTDFTAAVETEFGELLPDLIEAGYVIEEPWGKDYDDSEGWALWRFTQAGVDRATALEAQTSN